LRLIDSGVALSISIQERKRKQNMAASHIQSVRVAR
jgi:hypothetical protein